MSLTKEQIRQEVMKLDIPERESLIAELMREIDPKRAEQIDASWLAEAKRRRAEYESGKVQGIPLEEVLARFDKKIDR